MGTTTPGPWFTDGAEITPEGSACLIARMQGSQGGGDRLANAQLISAAPDLLSACEGLLALYDDTCGSKNSHDATVRNRARVAISKAKGKS